MNKRVPLNTQLELLYPLSDSVNEEYKQSNSFMKIVILYLH